jgi:opacity protein-like surface antigen
MVAAGFAVALLLGAAWPADAQQEPTAQVFFTGGYSNFLDEEPLPHAVFGGGAVLDMAGPFALVVELVYMRGEGSDRDWVFTPALTIDLPRIGRATPYVVGGAGYLVHTDAVGTGTFTSDTWTAGGGLGLRAPVSSRITLSAEWRLGFEPLTRLTASVAYRLGGGE